MSGRHVGRRKAALGGLTAVHVSAMLATPLLATAAASTEVDHSLSQALTAFRRMSSHQKRAAIKMLKRLSHGRSVRTVGLSFLLDCGWDRADAERLISNMRTRSKGGV